MQSQGADDERTIALQHENLQLRLRVAELERRLVRLGSEADIALAESYAVRQALLLEAERIAHVGTWIWDVRSNDVIWSDELYRILGYDPIVDKASADAFFAAVHPEDRDRVAAASAKTIGSGVSQQIDYRVQHSDGSVRYVSMDGALLLDDDGEVVRAVGTVRDVTSEREAREASRREAAMRELAEEAAHVGWLHHEVGTNEVSLSDALQRRFGLGKSAGVEELLARVVAPEAQQVLELWQPTRDMQPMQFCVRFAQDELGYVYVMPRAVMNDDVAVAVVAVVIDVSERVMLERQLQQTQKMTALGELAASVAHDINNTLMVIMCAAECLEVASTEAEEVSDIKRATESAAGLTRRLLLFSRQSALDPRSVDVGETLAETLVLVRRTIGDIVTVEEKLADAPPVHVDPVQLQQIVLNLALNARDAMPRGGTLRIACRAVWVDEARAAASDVEPGEYVEISVADTGLGIDAATQARMFEPFFTTKEPGRGTGLGLSTVFGAVKQAKGFIEFSSELGSGTTFRVLLPAHRELSVAGVVAPAAERPTERRRVLLVEDQPAVARALALMLGELGHQVVTHERPLAAVESWRRDGPFDLLVTDFMMPEMNGLSLAETLRREAPQLPVLMLSGLGFRPEQVAHLSGVVTLQKPFGVAQLGGAIERLLRGHSSPRNPM